MAEAEQPPELTEEDLREVLECARYGEAEDLKYLLSLGADSNYKDAGGSTALHKAAANGNIEIAEILLKNGGACSTNQSGNTPLHFACLNGHKEMVEWLLKQFDTLDVYAKNGFGRSAFTEAISAGHDDIARLLLQHKSADPAVAARAAGAGSGVGSDAASGGVEEAEEDVGDDETDLVDENAAKAEADSATGAGVESGSNAAAGAGSASASAGSAGSDAEMQG